MTARTHGSDIRTLSGALLLSFAFGSIHAFGVLLQALQISLQSDRASVSLVYSLAIASLTMGVGQRPFAVAYLQKNVMFAGRLIDSYDLLRSAYEPGLITCLRGYGLNLDFYNDLIDLPVFCRKFYFQQPMYDC